MARGGSALTVYAIYTATGSLSAQRVREAILVGVAILFVLLALAAYALYRRLMHYREEQTNQRQMVELGEAARTLAHEIKNPLGAIRLQQGILLRAAPKGLQGSVTIIGEEVARIVSLTERVREFLGNPKGDPQTVDLCRFLRELAARQEFPVEVTAPETPCLVKIDPDRMRSVVTNLMNNAWESMHALGSEMGQAGSPAVEVAVEGGGRTVRLRVGDRGPGIAPELLKRVFDPFFTTKERGTGVGLAITRRYVEGARGRVVASNRLGGGTDFVVELPREA
jgi:two-component system sensor histidine kinase HydH